jgi:peptidoglycan/LPS O-acetylase OafA/YrhL
MAALYQPDFDPARIYYGTDTRAAGLLIGAALAVAWPPGRPAAGDPGRGRLIDGLGGLALIGLVAAFALLNQDHPLLFRGGFALVSLLTAGVIVAVAHPGARLVPGLLGLAPLRWVGQRSYGIYLWHWPIFMVTRPYMDVDFDGPPLFALRFGLTFVVAALSYQFLERPIQQGALGRTWRQLRGLPAERSS